MSTVQPPAMSVLHFPEKKKGVPVFKEKSDALGLNYRWSETRRLDLTYRTL